MSPVDPAELSALLDGELPPQRAAEVREALAADTSLQQTYERLRVLDTEWKTQAAQAAFPTRVTLKRGLRQYRLAVASLPVGLLLLRFMLKIVDPFLGISLALMVFTVLIGWGLQRLVLASQADCRPFLRPAAN